VTRVTEFAAAKKVLRRHPGYSDAEVAEAAGIHELDIPLTVTPARRELVNTGELPDADATAAGSSR
jgi:hypothetical protein